MFLTRLQRRFTAWVALLTLVLGALAPTLAQASRTGHERADWMQICSASGMVWVQADRQGADEQPPGGSAPLADAGLQCPWCTLHGAGAGFAAAHALSDPAPHRTWQPRAIPTAPPAASAWSPPPSRGPPTA